MDIPRIPVILQLDSRNQSELCFAVMDRTQRRKSPAGFFIHQTVFQDQSRVNFEDPPILSMDLSNPTWWVYIALLVVAVYFRFGRVFTVRNLDLLLLLALSTSLTATVLLTPSGSQATDTPAEQATQSADQSEAPISPVRRPISQYWSTILLFTTLAFLVRLVLDERFTRRPRLEQNLNLGGLTFLCIPAFGILMSHVALLPPPDHNQQALRYGRALLDRQEATLESTGDELKPPAPTETLVAAGGNLVAGLAQKETDWVARSLVISAHTLVVGGMVLTGYLHFASLQLGISMACLYLLLPCTGVYVHQLSHVLPAACLVWAFVAYRRPLLSGILLGLACGTLFFAIFLLPLWAVFYGRKGGIRFFASVVAVAAVLISCLLLISHDASSFVDKLITTANWTVFRLLEANTMTGTAEVGMIIIRILMGALFFVMMTALTVIPRPRNFENLLGNSTCLIVAAQLWYPEDIGHYVLWYLPLLLMVIFRPRLDRLVPPESPSRQHLRQRADTAHHRTTAAV